jgi:hypothetical protein
MAIIRFLSYALLLRPARKKLVTQKYPNSAAIPAASKKCTCASWFVAVSRRFPRSFHAPPAAYSAKIPKKTPVNSSQSTPERRFTCPQNDSPNLLPPRASPCPVCTIWLAVRTVA